MISRLALFGATGDLAGRYLFPALAALEAGGRLPAGFEVVGAAREDLDDDAFRRHVGEHADLPNLRYRPVNLSDPDSVRRVVEGTGPVAVYLALPPKVFAPTLRSLAAADLPAGSRIAIEKPFGESLADARALNASLIELFGEAAEDVVFRVDHVLGMPALHRLLGLRRGSAVLNALWCSAYIEQIDVLWEEEIALEDRAGYFDATGTLKDVMQNHMLEVLASLTMELADGPSGQELRDRRAEVLAAVRPPTGDEVRDRTRRARYTAGRTGERDIPDYAREDGVDPARETETFAEVELRVDTPRWQETRFVLRAGKALARRRKGVIVRFRSAAGEELRIGIDGPFDVALRLTQGQDVMRLTAPPPEDDLSPYAHVLADVIAGDGALAVRGDEAEAAWRALTPVIDAWAAGDVPLEEYAAGSAGPAPRRS